MSVRAALSIVDQLCLVTIPEPVPEYRFAPPRRWRFDWCWPELKLALEQDGVLPGQGGRHQRMLGFEKDIEKLNEAALRGWAVIRFTPRMVRDGRALLVVERAYRQLSKVKEKEHEKITKA